MPKKGYKQTKEHLEKNRRSKVGNTWEKIHGKEKSEKLKEQYRKRFEKDNPMIKRGGWTNVERERLSKKFMGRNVWNKGKKGVQKNINMKGLEKGHGWNKGKKRPEKVNKKFIGKNNSNWLGGISFEPYDKSFNNLFKRRIRKRDNHVCILCGIHQEKLKRALSIHHINYDKLLTIPENCVSLCLNCHMKTNINREHWTKFFQSLLAKRYNYSYSENLEPIITL